MVRLVGLEPTTGKTPVDFKPTAYANFATAAPATRPIENITGAPARLQPRQKMKRLATDGSRTLGNSREFSANVLNAFA
jgi:hypothetical protein